MALERSGVAPERLCLEITETAMMADVGVMSETLTALKELGVRLAVDDFGVGHASLRRLRGWSCQSGQGYHFARPGEPEDIARMLAAPALRDAA